MDDLRMHVPAGVFIGYACVAINGRPTNASSGRGLAQIKMILKVRRLSLVINYQRYYAAQLMAARIAKYFYFLEFYYVDPLSS